MIAKYKFNCKVPSPHGLLPSGVVKSEGRRVEVVVQEFHKILCCILFRDCSRKRTKHVTLKNKNVKDNYFYDYYYYKLTFSLPFWIK